LYNIFYNLCGLPLCIQAFLPIVQCAPGSTLFTDTQNVCKFLLCLNPSCNLTTPLPSHSLSRNSRDRCLGRFHPPYCDRDRAL